MKVQISKIPQPYLTITTDPEQLPSDFTASQPFKVQNKQSLLVLSGGVTLMIDDEPIMVRAGESIELLANIALDICDCRPGTDYLLSG